MFDPACDCYTIVLGSPQQGQKRVLRGGSWNNNGRNLRSAKRNANHPGERNDNIGLRLAGALTTGGSLNQRCNLFRWLNAGGRSQGPRRVSSDTAAAICESLPLGRFFVFPRYRRFGFSRTMCCRAEARPTNVEGYSHAA